MPVTDTPAEWRRDHIIRTQMAIWEMQTLLKTLTHAQDIHFTAERGWGNAQNAIFYGRITACITAAQLAFTEISGAIQAAPPS